MPKLALPCSSGSGWGSGNYTTSVATGELDGDEADEIVIGRRSNVNMRYEILDDAKAGFAQIYSGGSGWGRAILRGRSPQGISTTMGSMKS